jgi:hypothetical protein
VDYLGMSWNIFKGYMTPMKVIGYIHRHHVIKNLEDQILILIVKYLVTIQEIFLIQEVPIRLGTELTLFAGRLKGKECANGSAIQSLDVFSVALEGVEKHVVVNIKIKDKHLKDNLSKSGMCNLLFLYSHLP